MKNVVHRCRFRCPLAGFAVLATLAALFGCAVGPDFKPEAPDAPASFSAWHGGADELADGSRVAVPAGAVPIAWAMFQDPVLDALQARAAGANQDLKTAWLRFEQSRTQSGIAGAQGGPQVNARGGATRQRASESGNTTRLIGILDPPNQAELIEGISAPYNLYQAGFDASWELDLWGRVRRAVEAADANAVAAEAMVAEVRLSIASEVARRYFELRALQRRIAVSRADIDAAAETLSLVAARADGGLATDLDTTRQRAQLADLRAGLPLLLAQEAQTFNQITLLLGERPGALQAELAARSGDDDAMPAPPDLALGLPSEVALRRPDIRRAQAQLHAATADIGVAVADLYPRVTLGAGVGFESLKSRSFGDWGSRQWSIGPSLQLPVFDGGRRHATITLRRLQQQEAAVAYQHTVLRAWHEIDDALNAYTAERQRNAQLAERERSSRDALALARVRYAQGLTDFLVQLDAERSWLQSRRDWIDSNGRLFTQLVAIAKAVGGPAGSGS